MLGMAVSSAFNGSLKSGAASAVPMSPIPTGRNPTRSEAAPPIFGKPARAIMVAPGVTSALPDDQSATEAITLCQGQ